MNISAALRSGILLSAFIAATAFSATPHNGQVGLPQQPLLFHSHLPHAIGLAKRSSPASLKWQQIGSTHFQNTAYSPDSSAQWQFSYRDTTIYDANGNQIVYKTSYAHSGWAIDSLQSFDSSVYTGGNLVEIFYESFSGDSGTMSSGNRQTYAWLMEAKF
jgi:hypothetical protein